MPEGWDLPSMNDLPECKAWCPAEKSIPPNETGLAFRSDQVRYVTYYMNIYLFNFS